MGRLTTDAPSMILWTFLYATPHPLWAAIARRKVSGSSDDCACHIGDLYAANRLHGDCRFVYALDALIRNLSRSFGVDDLHAAVVQTPAMVQPMNVGRGKTGEHPAFMQYRKCACDIKRLLAAAQLIPVFMFDEDVAKWCQQDAFSNTSGERFAHRGVCAVRASLLKTGHRERFCDPRMLSHEATLDDRSPQRNLNRTLWGNVLVLA